MLVRRGGGGMRWYWLLWWFTEFDYDDGVFFGLCLGVCWLHCGVFEVTCLGVDVFMELSYVQLFERLPMLFVDQ